MITQMNLEKEQSSLNGLNFIRTFEERVKNMLRSSCRHSFPDNDTVRSSESLC